ncbi:hypothetical protein SynA1825c_02328 [Synechococcus sp. A18-25c]|nr:hypothetical protein SynA1825c_02328 [Synechococcus sp. A18-25c]
MARCRTRSSSGPESHRCLERCWSLDCDLDPMILRVRWLRRQDLPGQAIAIEEELQPIF